MKTGFALAAALLAAPLLSVSALADEPEAKAVAKDNAEKVDLEPTETTADKPVEAAAPAVETKESKAEEKRICRRVRLDASSRRATKVCKTKEEWRLFNQRR